MRNLKADLTVLSIFLTLGALMLSASNGALAQWGPRNIIVMISDGCGYNHVDAASIYQHGETDAQIYHQFPIQYGVSTYMAGGSYDPDQAWNHFDYVKSGATDSAAAATAMSTGFKTYKGSIGMDSSMESLEHISQRAEQLGKATGVVTSVQFSHATPAGFVAHNISRNNYEQIAQEMILDSEVDVIMGCGNPLFNNNGQPAVNTYRYVGGSAVWDGLVAGAVDFDLDGDGFMDNSVEDADGDGIPDAWTLIQELSEFQALMSCPTPRRVIGVPQVHKTLQQKRSYSAFNQNVPTLEEMTRAALNVLDDDPDGLLLMIEGGAVDWASHANSSLRMIEEEMDFNNSVAAVVDWVQLNSNWDETLVIVTGDHETGYLTGPGSGLGPNWEPLVNNGAGNLPGMQWHSGSHTNSLIPFFANGIGSDLFVSYADEIDPVHGAYIDNAEIAQVVFQLMGLPVSAVEAIDNLIAIIDDMNLQRGIDNSLHAKVEAARDALLAENAGLRSDAGSKLEAFVNAVRAQRGKKLTGQQADQLVSCANHIILLLDVATVPAFAGITPSGFQLAQNYPNPFNPETWIPFVLGEAVEVEIRIYSISGALVRTLWLGQKAPGEYLSKRQAAYWDGNNEFGERVASGIYFYTIRAGDFYATKKMAIAE